MELLKGAIDNKINQTETTAVRNNYIAEKITIEDWDVYAIINNKDEKITEILNKWKEDYHLALLISAEVIEEIIIAFDIVNKDMIKGRIKFVSKDKDSSFYQRDFMEVDINKTIIKCRNLGCKFNEMDQDIFVEVIAKIYEKQS